MRLYQIAATLILPAAIVTAFQDIYSRDVSFGSDLDLGYELGIMKRDAYAEAYADFFAETFQDAVYKRAEEQVLLAARAFHVTGVSTKCATCMVRGLGLTPTTVPDGLTPAQYQHLDVVGAGCEHDGSCWKKHDESAYGESTMWSKAQGHARGGSPGSPSSSKSSKSTKSH
ncbi:hypothetical protein MMC19_007375 [Ptychographa xylographoides]|nr:hypothetical protein [Ptychographa xylographoides]